MTKKKCLSIYKKKKKTIATETVSMHPSESKHHLKETAPASPAAQGGGGGGGGGSSGGGASGTGGAGFGGGSQMLSAANHLEIPINNPNLLSPDILNQRRGNANILLTTIFLTFLVLKNLFIFIFSMYENRK